MVKGVVIFMVLLIYSSQTLSAPSDVVNVVYRADSRTIEQIIAEGGMNTWAFVNPDNIADNNLAHHFEGESITGHSTNFVSTSSLLINAIEHAVFTYDPDEPESYEDRYIYMIRPDNNFYDLDASFTNARDAAPVNSERRSDLDYLIRSYTGMHEMAAHGGFGADRIISYAVLTHQMIQHYGLGISSDLYTDVFWQTRWINNEYYNVIYNTDVSNAGFYPDIFPSGNLTLAENSQQQTLMLSETCWGLGSSSQQSYIQSSGSGSAGCGVTEKMKVIGRIYSNAFKSILYVILNGDFTCAEKGE